jgi:parallel beta-helix repeat protein
VEENTVFGNSNGLYLTATVQGNIIRRNLFVGNPAVQVSMDHPPGGGFDIKSVAGPALNTFVGNVCITGMNAPCPTLVVSLADDLQSLGCLTRSPVASCQLNVSQWNYYLTTFIDPNAAVLAVGDGTQEMTVQQYVQARSAAGLSSPYLSAPAEKQ